jgi:polyphosphate kinase 2 (PPK2 family)
MAKSKNGSKNVEEDKLDDLQLKMLRVQQGIWHSKQRVIIVFEGVDAAGKGGSIRRVTEKLDPRGFRVHPIGPPTPEEQGKHYLYRFWTNLPAPGTIAIFDRSWYGRVLVERVEKLIPKKRWKEAYDEINEFEKMLKDDGIILIKFFLNISQEEQLKRFCARLEDPYKQWKITPEDIRAREKWKDYQKAFEEMFEATSTKHSKWHVIDSNNKEKAREEVLTRITHHLRDAEEWIERQASALGKRKLEQALRKLESKNGRKA